VFLAGKFLCELSLGAFIKSTRKNRIAYPPFVVLNL